MNKNHETMRDLRDQYMEQIEELARFARHVFFINDTESFVEIAIDETIKHINLKKTPDPLRAAGWIVWNWIDSNCTPGNIPAFIRVNKEYFEKDGIIF